MAAADKTRAMTGSSMYLNNMASTKNLKPKYVVRIVTARGVRTHREEERDASG